MLRLADIEPDLDQPRIDLGDVSDLAASIREHGLIQPLVVSPIDGVRYRIIAGARRYEACKQVGLAVVPVIVRTETDQKRLEIQIIENLHRKDLNPFEEATGYRRLKDEFNLTDAEVAARVKRSRSRITEILSLTRIPEAIREECRRTDISLATLIQVAKQETADQMSRVLEDARGGISYVERRELSRKGKPRTPTKGSATKPKTIFRTSQEAVVIVQALTEKLTPDQTLIALEEALQQARLKAAGG